MVALLKMKTKLGVRGSEQIENTYTSVENRLKKKLKLDVSSPTSIRMESVWRETSAANETSKSPANTGMKEITPQEAPRAGRWSLDEKIMFLYGLSKYGKGRWKKISVYVPDRSLVQIKSHAQKVLKRMESGENVFRRLDENRERLEVLVAEAHARIEEDEAKHKDKGSRRRKRASIRKPTPPLPVYTSWDHLDIESAVQRRQQQHQKATGNDYSGASSPVPSLMSAEEENPDDHKENTLLDHELGESNDSTGSGAVIAAVAALCQLSSCGA